MASKISYEISIDELTLWVKDKTGMSDKKVEKVVEKLKGIDFDVFLNQEIEYFSEEIDAESSDEEEEKLSPHDWFHEQLYSKSVGFNEVLDDAEKYYGVDATESLLENEWKDLRKLFDKLKEEDEYCDDCEGKCRADETETCEKCSVELRIGCGNKPSDHSIFNGLCDDCREDETDDDCAECCRCGEDVSNDEGQGKSVDGQYWCVDCVEDAHQCELCKKYVEETEYLPSKEDEEKQQIIGNDDCNEWYKKVEKFEFVENIV